MIGKFSHPFFRIAQLLAVLSYTHHRFAHGFIFPTVLRKHVAHGLLGEIAQHAFQKARKSEFPVEQDLPISIINSCEKFWNCNK